MARIVGGLGTSHVPAIGAAIAAGRQQEPYWRPFFDGYPAVHRWLKAACPDVVVIFYNDHGLNFFLDKMPTFAVGAAKEYRNADEGWGLPVQRPFAGDPDFSWHVIEALLAEQFDLTTRQEMLVDHAVTVPMSLMWPGQGDWPAKIVPIAVNTVQHPLPSAARCFRLGQAVGRAIERYAPNLNVLVVGSGGLSHQLDGARAGFINKPFDLFCMDRLVDDPQALTKYSTADLVEQAGTQGVELLNWLAMRGALGGRVSKVHSNYHVPVSNTASGILLLETSHCAPQHDLPDLGIGGVP
ncbi:MAG TPA: class III extradiol dioxygenase family protein [Rhizomicrobium sp.]